MKGRRDRDRRRASAQRLCERDPLPHGDLREGRPIRWDQDLLIHCLPPPMRSARCAIRLASAFALREQPLLPRGVATPLPYGNLNDSDPLTESADAIGASTPRPRDRDASLWMSDHSSVPRASTATTPDALATSGLSSISRKSASSMAS